MAGTTNESGTIISMADLVDAHFGTPTEVIITKIQYVVYGMAVQLLWDATTPTLIATLEGHDTLDLTEVGGMPNTAGTGKNGNILLITQDASAGDSYTIVIEMVKKYR